MTGSLGLDEVCAAPTCNGSVFWLTPSTNNISINRELENYILSNLSSQETFCSETDPNKCLVFKPIDEEDKSGEATNKLIGLLLLPNHACKIFVTYWRVKMVGLFS